MRSSSHLALADSLRKPILLLGLAIACLAGATAFPAAALAAESPVAAYGFNEGQGETAYDSAGDHDGEVEGTWTEAGTYGGALDFNGTGDRVKVPDDDVLDFTDAFTFEAWVRPEEYREWASLFSKAGAEEPDYSFLVYSGNNSGPPRANVRDSEEEEAEVEGEEALPLNTWSHVAATSDGEDLRLYVDGDLVDTQPAVIAEVNSYPIRIGGHWDWSDLFDGKIDEVRFYDEALTKEEIEDDMATAIDLPSLPSKDPVAAYSFDEGFGKTLHDDTGNGNDGAIEGGEWVAGPFGPFGSALKFDGEAEDCVSVPNSPELQLDDEFTLEAWAKPEGTNGSEPLIYKETEYFFSYGLYLGIFNGGTEGLLAYEPFEYSEVGGEELPISEWSTLALSYDEEDLRLYLDGELVDSTESSDAISSEGDLSIGCSKNFGDEFTGVIDNIRIYDRALSPEEIEEDEAVGVGTPHSDPSFNGQPKIKGQAEEGKTLSVDLFGLRGTPPLTIEYEWERCYLTCEVISEATSDSYTTVPADIATQLRVKVTASNENGELSVWSLPTAFIASSQEEGKPIMSSPPRIGGLFRVTDKVAATFGEWTGEAPIDTDLEWERCEPSGESCEGISGATKQTYEMTEADQGSRLRVRITAVNEAGSKAETSQLSKIVRPASNTTFAFEAGTDLEEVEDAVDEGELTWISVSYGDETSGVYRVPPETTDVVNSLSTVLGESTAGFPVFTIELAGAIATESMGSLAGNVESREVGPSLRYPNDSKGAAFTEDLENFTKGAVRRAMLSSEDDTTGEEGVGGMPYLPGYDRALYTSFYWKPTLGEMLNAIYENGSPLALEYDLRQINRGNTDLAIDIPGLPPFQVSCLPWEENNFWLGSRDPVLIVTDIPADAGIYWDTGAEDPCTVKDLTYGVYHPEALEESEEYTTVVYFDGGGADGDASSSGIEWSFQILGEHCDHSPWCVNIPGEDIEGATSTIISESDIFSFPEPPTPGPGALPGCWTYWNPLYEVTPYVELGTHPCSGIT